MNYEFIKDIIGSPWQIEPRTLNSLYPVFRGMFSGFHIEQGAEPKNHLRSAISAITRDIVAGYYADDQPELMVEEEPEEKPQAKIINVLPLRGVLTKHDQDCGPRGTRTLAGRLLESDEDENVIGHIMVIESGGGQVSAVPELTDAIGKLTKPIVVWIDGCACSAAYYIACYCKEIIASRDMDMVGCIGTMITWEGRKSKSPENEDGEISVTIYADSSPEKNLEWEKAINEFDFTLAKERLLNPFNEKFQADVMANRPQVLPAELKGRTYMAHEVEGSLIDSIGDFSMAIDRVLALAKFSNEPTADPTEGNQQITNTPIEMNQFPHLNSVLNVEALESTEDGAFLNEEQFASLEERLELNQQLATERDNAVQELATASLSLSEAQATIATAYDPFNAIDPTVASAETPEAKAQAVRTLLAVRPAVLPVQAIGLYDDVIANEVDWEAINNLPHNKAVDANS